MTDLQKGSIPEDLVRLLFSNALEGGVTEVAWEDAPKLMAKLEAAGLTVRGEMFECEDFGRFRPVISVELKIKIKEFK